MDNEVSNGMHITVQLIILSVIVGMLALFTTMGQAFGRQASTTVADTLAETYATELVTMADYGAVPAASVYVMLQKNANTIRFITGAVYTVTINEPEDFTKLMSKKVRLTLTKINDSYDVLVEEE